MGINGASVKKDRPGKEVKAYLINESDIETMSEQINEYMSGLDMDPRTRNRIQFAMDELLLRIADHFGNDKEVSLRMGKQFGS